MTYFRPTTLDEAMSILAVESGRILAGGTDFFPAVGEHSVDGALVDISGVTEIRGISSTADEIRIGGGATWADVAAAALPSCFDGLKAAARQVGSIQIQNCGTVAGNICNASPAADGIPPLLTLDAEVELVSVDGKRRLPLSDFLTGYRSTRLSQGEILSAIIVKRTIDRGRSAFLKLGSRSYLVISIAMVAAVIECASGRISQARIAVGSCSAVAKRLYDLEALLVGVAARPGLGEVVRSAHLERLTPVDDVRATASYRYDAALTLTRRAIESCVAAA